MKFTYTHAILKIRPEATFTIKDNEYNTLRWFDEVQTKPTEEEIKTQLSSMENDFNSNLHQFQRQVLYPPISDLADAIYWQANGDSSKMDEYIAKVTEVKQKFPKN